MSQAAIQGFNISVIILSISPLAGFAGWLFWDAIRKPKDEDQWYVEQDKYYDDLYYKNLLRYQKLKEQSNADQSKRDNDTAELHRSNFRRL